MCLMVLSVTGFTVVGEITDHSRYDTYRYQLRACSLSDAATISSKGLAGIAATIRSSSTEVPSQFPRQVQSCSAVILTT